MKTKLYQNKDWLYEQYWAKELFMRQIAEICKVAIGTIHYWMIKFNIPVRSRSEYLSIGKEILPDEKKRCSKCKEIRSIGEFYKNKSHKDGLCDWCKLCQRKFMKGYYKEYIKTHKEERRNYAKEYYRTHKEQCDKYSKEYRRTHKEERRKTVRKYERIHREQRKEYLKEYNKTHKEQNRKRNKKYYWKTLKNNSKYKLNRCISTAICKSLKGKKGKRHWETLVGYTLKDLMRHLKKQFTPQMTWENHGLYWHIDHIIPVSVFNYTSPKHINFKKCWALENLRPLEKSKNQTKCAKIIKQFQPLLKV